ncbi:MAG: DUF3565 domain-containing protein [Gammaproteobacteria bacterium]
MIAFHQDELKDWVADLICGHTQHVRHQPPFQNCPWVVDERSRKSYIGYQLYCLDCDKEY